MKQFFKQTEKYLNNPVIFFVFMWILAIILKSIEARITPSFGWTTREIILNGLYLAVAATIGVEIGKRLRKKIGD